MRTVSALAGVFFFSLVGAAAACECRLTFSPERVRERMHSEEFDADGLDAFGCTLKGGNEGCGGLRDLSQFVPVQRGYGRYAKPLKEKEGSQKK